MKSTLRGFILTFPFWAFHLPNQSFFYDYIFLHLHFFNKYSLATVCSASVEALATYSVTDKNTSLFLFYFFKHKKENILSHL